MLAWALILTVSLYVLLLLPEAPGMAMLAVGGLAALAMARWLDVPHSETSAQMIAIVGYLAGFGMLAAAIIGPLAMP